MPHRKDIDLDDPSIGRLYFSRKPWKRAAEKYWRIKVYAPDLGVRFERSLRTKDYDEACVRLANLRKQRISVEALRLADTLIEVALERFLESRKTRQSERSLKRLREGLADFARTLGKMPVRSVSTGAIEDWAQARRGKISDLTFFKVELGGVRRLFAWLRAHEYIERNPCDLLCFPRQVRRRRARDLPDDILEEILAEIDDERFPWARPFFLVIRYSGLRQETMRRLIWEEADLVGERWIIPGEKLKTREPHYCPMDPRAARELREWQVIAEREYGYFMPEVVGRRSKVIQPHLPVWIPAGDLQRTAEVWRLACSHAGYVEYQITDLRVAFTTELYRRGVPEHIVGRLTAHASTEVLRDFYWAPSEDDLRRHLGSSP